MLHLGLLYGICNTLSEGGDMCTRLRNILTVNVSCTDSCNNELITCVCV